MTATVNLITDSERAFYLEQFTGRTLIIASAAEDEQDRAAVSRVAASLAVADVRVIVLCTGGRVVHWAADDAGIVAVWRQLRRHGHMQIALPTPGDVHDAAVALSGRVRAFKLALCDPTLPRATDDDQADSFVTLTAPATRTEGSALARLAAAALVGGVSTVNVCHPVDLERELLSYAGAGTFYTLQDYCRVEALGIDDYTQVTQMIEGGAREGYLKPRDPDAVARLVVNGFGARVGDHHLAGFGALLTEPYIDQGLGELCALTTISRFGGGGVGGQIVGEILRQAVNRRLLGVFACTASASAAGFFRRLGFVEVPQAELPPVKWTEYDPERRATLRAFMHHLVMIDAPGAGRLGAS